MDAFQSVNMMVHVIVGSLGLAGAIVALATVKGSPGHIRGGKVFVWTSILVVLTSLLSMFHELLPLAIVLALAVVYLIPSALLSVNRGFRGFRPLNILLMALAGLLCIFSIVQFLRVNFELGQFLIGPIIMAAMFGFLFAQDWHMLRADPPPSNFWIRRHLVRMILAFTIALMAVVRIGLNFGLSLEASVVIPLGVAVACIAWVYRRYPLTTAA